MERHTDACAIVDFVGRVSEDGGANYVAPHERIAVFDNDGTRWPEKPIPIQLDCTTPLTMIAWCHRQIADSTSETENPIATSEPVRACSTW